MPTVQYPPSTMYALVDCNNFFVSCERLFRPELEGKPVVVLSNNDGCFISRSQEAKDLGLPMGAPLFKWKNEVNVHGVQLFSANFELYGDISERIVTLLREVTPLIEVYSIDECFMDLSQLPIGGSVRALSSVDAVEEPNATGAEPRRVHSEEENVWTDALANNSPYEVWARELRERIWREIGVPVSIGVAPTKTLAKVASTYAKKHGGSYAVTDDAHREALLKGLPIEDIWGVGWRMAPKLRDRGISTAWQLVSASDGWLRQQFNITGLKMVDELRGQARLPFGDKHDQRKTIMRSRMFGHKVRNYHQLESALATFAAQAAQRLRAQDSVARRVVVFLSANKHAKDAKRVYLSTVVVLPEASADTARIVTATLEGLEQIYDDQFAYQKGGVVLIDIADRQAWQLSMLTDESRRDERLQLMHSVDYLNKKYGHILYHAAEKMASSDWHSKHDLRSPRYTTSWTEIPSIRA